MDYREIIKEICSVDSDAMEKAKERQDSLAKPPGSLGKLEEISIRLAGISGRVKYDPEKCTVLVFAADNGIVDQGVSSAPRSVTLSQTINMTRYITGMSSLAHYFGDAIIVTDVGVAEDVHCDAVVNKKIRYGTADFSKEPAMTREEAEKAINIGLETAVSAIKNGADCIGIGEMGIGNTSTSSALIATFAGVDASAVSGYGGTITDAAYRHKVEVISDSLKLHKPDPEDVVGAISLVGGLDIAAMAGAFLGCAYMHVPVVIDGFISVTAAICAAKLCDKAAEYMFMSHISAEPGYQVAVETLQKMSGRRDLVPYFDLGMRLGEGSGCPIMFRIIKSAAAVMGGMATFAEAAINDDYLEEVRTEMKSKNQL